MIGANGRPIILQGVRYKVDVSALSAYAASEDALVPASSDEGQVRARMSERELIGKFLDHVERRGGEGYCNVSYTHSRIGQALIDAGAGVNDVGGGRRDGTEESSLAHGVFPLFYAVQLSLLNAVQMLVSAGAEPNQVPVQSFLHPRFHWQKFLTQQEQEIRLRADLQGIWPKRAITVSKI